MLVTFLQGHDDTFALLYLSNRQGNYNSAHKPVDVYVFGIKQSDYLFR